MKRRKLSLILACILLVALGTILGFFLAGFRSERTVTKFDRAISHLEYYAPGNPEPQLVDIELGLSRSQLENKFPGMELYAYPSMDFCVCVYQNQRALVFFDTREEIHKVNGYAVYNDRREPLEVNLNAAYPYYYGQMAPAALADADFENLTLYDLMDQYGLGHKVMDTFTFKINLLLSDGRVMTIAGPSIAQSPAYYAFRWSYFGSYDSFCWNNNPNRPIGSNTFIRLVELWDIFQFKPGMSMEDCKVTTRLARSVEDVHTKNDVYFLRFLKEHPPESWDPDYLNDWIDRYMPKDDESTEETSP